MTEAGLKLSEQAPLSHTARVDLDGQTATQLHRFLATTDAYQDTLVAAIRESLKGMDAATARDVLDAAGVDALDGLYQDLVLGVARGQWNALGGLLTATRSLGTGQTPFDLRSPVDDIMAGDVRLFALADRTPTIVVRIHEEFRDQRADQRRDVCRFLSALATGCDVRLVGTRLDHRWLVTEHRAELPASLSEKCNSRRSETPTTDIVEAATEAIDTSSRELRILRLLADEDTQTLPYSAIRSEFAVSNSRISQHLGTLKNLELIDTFGPRGQKFAELRPAAETFLDRVDTEIGRQRRLGESLNEAGQRASNLDVNQRKDGKEASRGTAGDSDGTTDCDRVPSSEVSPRPGVDPEGGSKCGRYRVRWLDRTGHAAPAAAAPENGIAAVSRAVEERDNRGDAWISYEGGHDELVVGTQPTTPLQLVVPLARGLTSGRIRGTALTDGDLDDVLSDGDYGLLRDCRQLGWLSEDVEDGAEFWDELQAARDDLLELTHDLRQKDDPDERKRLCREILQLAHGLAGVVVHALDRVGVDIVREVRIPQRLSEDQREELVRTLAHSTEIQSRYGEFSAFRQLREDRERYRDTAMSPRVDASDPFGSYIGSMTLVGPQAGNIARRLQNRLEKAEIHEDAPEFAIPYPIDVDPGRPAVEEVVERMCSHKRLRPTDEAAAILDALLKEPYAVAETIDTLAKADYQRKMRLDEVRFALASTSATILPDKERSVGTIVQTLCQHQQPMSQTELADTAGVSNRTVRRHSEVLAALDLVRLGDSGYEVALPTESEDEKDEAPAAVIEELQSGVDLVEAVAEVVTEDKHVLREARRPPDPGERLRSLAALPAVRSWARTAMRLAAATHDHENPPPRELETTTFGPRVAQTALPRILDSSRRSENNVWESVSWSAG